MVTLISHRFLALVFEESESVHTGVVYNGVVGGVDGVEDFAMSDKRSVWVVEVKPEEEATGSVFASVVVKDASQRRAPGVVLNEVHPSGAERATAEPLESRQ